ncbi:MAG: PAS domain S-box protein, partial [Desulfobacteraceae bacterium]|nr:PAS domain S-box protein [Desulfobacteraceae bacterium]
NFKELVDMSKLQDLTDELYNASSIPSAIVAMDGEVLTGSGWQRICTDFHRKHPQIEKECIKSDIKIRKALDRGEPFVLYKCPRGLVDASSPVIIAGEHVANVFAGQIFLEPPDETTELFFRKQAHKFDFDEKEYIKAYREIPVFTEKKFKAALFFLAKLAKMVADMGFARLHELESVQALLESQSRFKVLYDNIPLAYQSLDSEGKFIEVNPSWLSVLGYSQEEVIGKFFSDFLHPDWKDHFEKNFPRFKAVGEVLGAEFEMIKKDGSIILVSFHGKIGKDKQGNFQQTHCIFHDITDKKMMENRLHSYSHDLNERVKELNCLHEVSILAEEKDTPLDELMQKIIDLIPPAWQYPKITCSRMVIGNKEYRTENFQETIWNQKSAILTYEKRIGILEVFYLDEKPEMDEGPFLKEERALIDVIAERLGNIIEQRQNESDTQAIVESTVGKNGQGLFDFIVIKLCEWLKCDCVIIGQIIGGGNVKAVAMALDNELVNDYSYKLKGSPCDKTAQRNYCIYPENVCVLFPEDHDLVEMNAVGYVGVSLKNKNGEIIGVLCGISRNKLLATKHTKNVMKIIATRISSEMERMKIEKEKNKLEALLQQSQRMESIGTLAGGIAHDFNNILFPIVGHTEMLIEDAPEKSPLKKSLNEIYKGALRARDLVQQILTFSRQENSELTLMKIQHIIKEILKLTRATIPTTIEIKKNIQSDCGAIKADPTQIHQIIMNLTTNANHAMEKTGGVLNISLKEVEIDSNNLTMPDIMPGDYARLVIADTGEGMEKDIIDKIFDPFFTTKEIGKGTGMGLSVVHGIVKKMDGAISVYSEPGKGTAFHIYLPIVKNLLEKPVFDQEPEDYIQGGTERILLVDDEEHIIAM